MWGGGMRSMIHNKIRCLKKENERLKQEIMQWESFYNMSDEQFKEIIGLQDENHRLEGGVNLLRQRIDDLERELDDVRPYKEWYQRRCEENWKLKNQLRNYDWDPNFINFMGKKFLIRSVTRLNEEPKLYLDVEEV